MSLETGGQSETRSAHDHHTLLYESLEERFDTVARYVETGLRNDERCLYLTSDSTASEVRGALRRRGVDVDAPLEAGDLSIRPIEEGYFTDGTFDSAGAIEFLEGAVSEALAAGYGRLRITGETDWVADQGTSLEALEEHERRVDTVFPNDALIALCQYDRSKFPSEVLDTVLRTHPQVTRDAEPRSTRTTSRPRRPGGTG